MTPVLDVIVVIVSFNSSATIAGLLDSLAPAMGGLTYATIVVDNGSADNTVGLAAARGDCTVVRSTNTGYAGGINVGARVAEPSRYLLVLNADVVLQRESVGRLVVAADSSGAAVVAPRTLTPAGDLDLTLRREPTLLRALGLNRTGHPLVSEYVKALGDYEDRREVDWAVGSTLLLDRTVFDALNGWDESYFMYSEETDYCLRVQDRGHSVLYEPSAVVTHIGGGSGRNDWTHSLQIVNRVRLYARRHRRLASYAYLAATVLGELTWIARGHPQSRAAVSALLRPSTRPAELNASVRLLPH